MKEALLNNILITGSHGMLGQDLLKVFPGAVGMDRDELDITNEKQVHEVMTKLRPTLVINAAAYNDVDACETPQGHKAAQALNVDAVGYLAEACVEHNATLVHYSTGYVFAGAKKEGYAEDDIPAPVNTYGQTKYDGEQAIIKYSDKLTYYIIRTSKLFGKAGNSAAAKRSFFDTMLALAKEKKELQIIDDELSNFTYTPDLAQMTRELVEGNYAKGMYHIVNEHPATWYDGARALFDITAQNVTLMPVSATSFPRPAARPKYGILLNTKLPKLRGYEEALREFLMAN